MNKSKLPTNKRQMKKLLKNIDNGTLGFQLKRHKALGNDKGVAKIEQLMDKARQLKDDLKKDAEWKAVLDSTRPARIAKLEEDLERRMAAQERGAKLAGLGK